MYLVKPAQLKEVSIMTTINYAVSGNRRKELVNALAEILECGSEYLKAPSYAYRVGKFTVNRDG